MSNWRELGVIPDSEDEDNYLSDDEAPPLSQTQVPIITTSIPQDQYSEDIWDFPESDNDEQDITTVPVVSPLSSRPILPERLEPAARTPAVAEDTTQHQVQPSTPKNVEIYSPLPASTVNEVASYSNQGTEDAFSFTSRGITAAGNNSTTIFDSSRLTPQKYTVTTGDNETDRNVSDWEVREATSSHRRSLRPRKPIQEHPYLLENAQYSTFLRQHGVKPVKMTTDTERRQLAEALPDDDFEQYSQDGTLPLGTQRKDGDVSTIDKGEHDRLDMSPASSILTQLYNQSTCESSTGSPANPVDDILWDQDLPDLDQLLNQGSRAVEQKTAIQGISHTQPLTQRTRRRDIIYSDTPEPSTAITRMPSSSDPFAELSDFNTQQTAHPIPSKTIDRPDYPAKTLSEPIVSASVIEVSSQEVDSQDGHGQEYQEGSETGDDIGNDTHQLVTEFGRHIRGVLPASWLRLDQQLNKNNSHQSPKKRPRHQLPNQQQRGIALRKAAVPNSATFDPLSPDIIDEELPIEFMADDTSERQHEATPSPTRDQEIHWADENLVEEETPFESVVAGSKRQLQLPKTSKSRRKRIRVSNGSWTQSVQTHSRQQAITSFLHPHPQSDEFTGPLTIDHFSDDSWPRSNTNRGRSINKQKQSLKPLPLLSILDTIGPDAPRFIRIAARSARQTLSQGRSSIKRKIIRLAARQDQVDVMSVLEEWKSGFIKQRPSVSMTSRSKQKQHARTNIPQNRSGGETTSHVMFGTVRSSSRKLVKYLGESGLVSYRRNGPSENTSTRLSEMSILPSLVSRTAQLEVDERAKRAAISFHSRKGALDHVFSKQKKKRPFEHLTGNTNTSDTGSGFTKHYVKEHILPRMDQNQGQDDERRQPRTPPYRKKMKPRRINVNAPQYTHANDPLPLYSPAVIDLPPEKSKLYGLGPYGTQYTRHFEVFPLMPGVRFHKSTLLGRGILETLGIKDSHLRISKPETQISIRLDDQVFHWGSWNPKVSSEVGILFDIIAEQLEGKQQGAPDEGYYAIEAIDSTLEYVTVTLASANVESSMPPLLPRLREVLRSFINRVNSGLSHFSFDLNASRQLALKIFDRVLLISYLLVKYCQRIPKHLDQDPDVDDLLLSVAKLMISILLQDGLSQVKQIYQDLSKHNCRDHILAENAVAIHSWTMLIKTFEHAGLHRVSFWDVLETIILGPDLLSSTNALEFERVWEIMFTLLPLFEFDASGKIVTEKRSDAGVEGWAIPQKLIRRVFQIYQESNHQAASFNSYCRALISRCHYLVQQWGWCRSASVIGVIFDFFGSQRLAHLRNEEVYQSPRFLENLANEPILDIEADDYCFHIFLKFLAITIKNLERSGSEKDIRNLVTRTIPNHDRLYLKEHDVHERDLAALRNHHDLIGTLFWATPSKIRPPVTLVERLITPANSHKEACLINIRAWAQLARFIVSSGETRASFEPFKKWRNTFFHQIMSQFDGIAADIHQQYLALSKDTSKSVTQDVVDTMISKNKAAVMEIIYVSFTASVDVMRHASDLEAATYCLNTLHLDRIFQYFTVSPSELDYSILRAALAILDIFLSKIEEFKETQESQQSESQILNSAQADDAFLILDQELSRTFFSMAQCILSSSAETPSFSAGMANKSWCVKQIVTLSARMGIGFINGGLFKISDMLKPGKYCLFSDQIHALGPSCRQRFVLFISTLLKHGFIDFSDAGFDLCEVWVLTLATPLKHLDYEDLLEIQRHCYSKGFIPDNAAELTHQFNYKTKQHLFEYAVSWMRKTIRQAGPNLRRKLDPEFSKILKLVMKQMRNDLGLMYSDTSQHQPYVIFVQSIISSIKTHGSDICAIDNFFLQISREYFPPIQDPQLQIAGMLSYGIRIEEGDPRAAHQLFFLLFNNFKYALASGNLSDDVRMLWKGMRNKCISAFVLGKMLPAIIRVAFMNSLSFPLLDVYTEALRFLLNGSVLSQQLDNEDLPHIAITLRAIAEGLSGMRLRNEILSGSQMHILRQALAISNLLWPSLLVANSERLGDSRFDGVNVTIRHIASFATSAKGYLKDMIDLGSDSLDTSLLFKDAETQTPSFDMHVNSFTANISDDIAKNWKIHPERISIHMPTTITENGRETNGVDNPTWVARDIVNDLYNCIEEWHWWWVEFR